MERSVGGGASPPRGRAAAAPPAAVMPFLVGVMDAVNVTIFFKSLLRNWKLTKLYGWTICLNLFVLMGSSYLLGLVVEAIGYAFGLSGHGFGTMSELLASVLWKFPLYLIGYPMNLLWGGEMFDLAYRDRYRRRPSVDFSYRAVLETLTDKVYYFLVVLAMIALSAALNIVPSLAGRFVGIAAGTGGAAAQRIGGAAGFFCATLLDTWMYSFYAFDPRFNELRNVDFKAKVEYFEMRWAYFLGFGAPSAVLMIYTGWRLGGFYGQVLYFVLSPIHTLISVEARPERSGGSGAPIFTVPRFIADQCVRLFFKKKKKAEPKEE